MSPHVPPTSPAHARDIFYFFRFCPWWWCNSVDWIPYEWGTNFSLDFPFSNQSSHENVSAGRVGWWLLLNQSRYWYAKSCKCWSSVIVLRSWLCCCELSCCTTYLGQVVLPPTDRGAFGRSLWWIIHEDKYIFPSGRVKFICYMASQT